MKAVIISYSRTGCNEALASSLASKLSVENIKIVDKKSDSYFNITLNLMFNGTPGVRSVKEDIENVDLVIVIGPVWFSKVAFPLRKCLKEIKKSTVDYIFISLSGGGDGAESNPNLASDLVKRSGKKPLLIMNFFIADLLPSEPKPTPDDIYHYKITKEDIKNLTGKVVESLNPYLSK